MECILVALPFILGLVALIQWLIGNEEGARRTEDAINQGISGLGRNLFLWKCWMTTMPETTRLTTGGNLLPAPCALRLAT